VFLVILKVSASAKAIIKSVSLGAMPYRYLDTLPSGSINITIVGMDKNPVLP
jgi:hypothetical protein